MVVYVAAHLWIVGRLVELDTGRLARSLAVTLGAAGAMALALLAVGTEHLSPLQWVAGLALGIAAYAAVLLLAREVTVGELRSLAGRLGPRSRVGG